ncbi:DMT family transporter [Sutcliffiella cohnii]|uniref:DMT family transporter n=1 Tax=Sutcliffiella cohnii TaxID=33932 RepID=UPI002E2165D6|nr:DMT family transporter [Sutcliffiella cohnii]
MASKYYGLLLLTSFLWAGNFIVSKGLVDHASAMTLTVLRWAIAVIVLFPIVWWKEKKILPSRKAILPLFLMGITGAVLFNIFLFIGLENSTASNIGLLSTLNIVSIALFSFIFLKEKINPFQIGSMVISLLGVLLVMSKGNLEYLLSLQFNSGDVWMLAAVGIWGIYSVCNKWASATTSPMMAILYSGVFGLIVLVPFNTTGLTVTNINPSFIGAILYTGVISTVVCMVLWNIGVQKIGATTSGLFLNFNPIFTAMLAFFLLGEEITLVQGIGSGIVILGSYLFTYFKAKQIPAKIVIEPKLQNEQTSRSHAS